MWRCYFGAAGILLVLASAAGSVADPLSDQLTADQRQAIATIPEEYVERALADDWEAVSELYHEDAIVMLPDEPPVEGRDQIREAFAQMMGTEGGVRLAVFSVEVLEAEGLGDLVYVRAGYRFAVAMLDDEDVALEAQGPYVNILRRNEAGAWRIYRQIVNRDHPPASPE